MRDIKNQLERTWKSIGVANDDVERTWSRVHCSIFFRFIPIS